MNETDFEILRQRVPVVPIVQVTIASLNRDETEPMIKEYSVTAHVKDRHARVTTEFMLFNYSTRSMLERYSWKNGSL